HIRSLLSLPTRRSPSFFQRLARGQAGDADRARSSGAAAAVGSAGGKQQSGARGDKTHSSGSRPLSRARDYQARIGALLRADRRLDHTPFGGSSIDLGPLSSRSSPDVLLSTHHP